MPTERIMPNEEEVTEPFANQEVNPMAQMLDP